MKIVPKFTHKYNPAPRLSANQVGNYLSANVSSRKRILSEAKFPPTMILVRYEDARVAIATHLTLPRNTKTILVDTLAELARRGKQAGTTPWKKTNHRLCTDAIEAFQTGEGKIGIAKTTFRAPDRRNTRLIIAGVSISVALDVMTESSDNDGNKLIGGTVLVFSKTGGADTNMASHCQAIALLAARVVEEYLAKGERCDPTMCMALDVLGGKVYRATGRYKRALKAISDSCEEVATLWPSIKPPKDYEGPPIPKP